MQGRNIYMEFKQYKTEKDNLTKQILKDRICYLALHKKRTATDIATELEISKALILEYIRELKEQGLIHRYFSLKLSESQEERINEICAMHYSEEVENTELERVSNLKDKIYYLAIHERQNKTYISEELGISKETVRKYIEKLKSDKRIPVNFSFRQTLVTDEIKEKVLTLLLKEKKSTKDVMNELEISRRTVYTCIDVLRREGKLPNQFTPSKRSTNELKEKIYFMLIHEQKRPATIANELGYGVANIYRYIQELKKEGKLPNNRLKNNPDTTNLE